MWFNNARDKAVKRRSTVFMILNEYENNISHSIKIIELQDIR